MVRTPGAARSRRQGVFEEENDKKVIRRYCLFDICMLRWVSGKGGGGGARLMRKVPVYLLRNCRGSAPLMSQDQTHPQKTRQKNTTLSHVDSSLVGTAACDKQRSSLEGEAGHEEGKDDVTNMFFSNGTLVPPLYVMTQ